MSAGLTPDLQPVSSADRCAELHPVEVLAGITIGSEDNGLPAGYPSASAVDDRPSERIQRDVRHNSAVHRHWLKAMLVHMHLRHASARPS